MAWYDDNKALTHISSYNNAQDATRETERAARKGWTPQGTAATIAVSRTGGKIVITYTRTPEWLAEREKIRQSIQRLDALIRSKEPALNAARAERNAAQTTVAQRQADVKLVENQIAGIGTAVLSKTGAAYLNGPSIDRGTVELGHEDIRFNGWGGGVNIPLAHVRDVDTGKSWLGPLAGVPVIQRVWTGSPRPGDTLLLTIQETDLSWSVGLVIMLTRSSRFGKVRRLAGPPRTATLNY